MYYLHFGVLKSAPGKQHIFTGFLQDSCSKICLVIHKCILTHYIMPWLFVDSGMIYHLGHFWCLASFLLFSLNSVTASPSGTVASSPSQWVYIFWRLFLPLSCPISSPRRQTAVFHKMVDQSLFPAHPNWRCLGALLGWWFDPTFY